MSGKPNILSTFNVPLSLIDMELLIDAMDYTDQPEGEDLHARLRGYRSEMVAKINAAASPMPADSETSC